MANAVELEQVKLKSDINLVTMAIGKVDDNLNSIAGSMREMNKEIVEIRITMASIESLEKRVAKLEETQAEIKDVPNKILFRVVVSLCTAGALGALAWFKGV